MKQRFSALTVVANAKGFGVGLDRTSTSWGLRMMLLIIRELYNSGPVSNRSTTIHIKRLPFCNCLQRVPIFPILVNESIADVKVVIYMVAEVRRTPGLKQWCNHIHVPGSTGQCKEK